MSSQYHFTALPLELHNHIFSDLQPYDILQVLQTCKALYLVSWQRTVWMDALHRICVENTLFEPSFPVASMSVLELQHASMGPHLWIARSSSKDRNILDGVPPRSITQHLMSAVDNVFNADLETLHNLYLVPGGRYFFSLSSNSLVLWDLGSPYSSGRKSDCIQVAAVPSKTYRRYLVHSTPDGMGLRLFLGIPDNSHLPSSNWIFLYIYEIYPESKSPQLRQIACTRILNLHSYTFYSLSHDHLIFACRKIVTVWNYKANTWARWSIEGKYKRILTTKSAVMLIRSYGVSVWEIPSLLPESSLSMSTDPSVMSPAFELHYPKDHPYQQYHHAPSSWYSGTSQPIYYDVQQHPDDFPPNINRFEVTINSKISGGTLNLLKTFKIPTPQYVHSTREARICQDTNVKICTEYNTGCLGTHVTGIHGQDQQLSSFVTPFLYQDAYDSTFCPSTGRVVYCKRNHESPSINVLDLNHF